MMPAPIRVLYVDDESGLLEIGKLFLERSGDFTVTTSISAPDAIRLLEQERFDAIISDYQMPGMDGIQFLVLVRTRFGKIPFILFTGKGREEVVIQAINSGADFYLQKGGDPGAQFAELSHKIKQAVQQRRAEVSIRDHERLEVDIINFLPDATFAIDTNGVVIAWNHAMEEMTGIKAAEILGRGNYEYSIPVYHERRPILIDLILHEDPSIAAKYPSLIRDGRTLIAEATNPYVYNGRGATIWFTAAPLYNSQGIVVGAIESIRDITERKRAEERLMQQTDAMEAAMEGIAILDRDQEYIYMNKAHAGLYGYNASELIGASWRILYDTGELQRFEREILPELSEKGYYQGRALGKKKDGSTFSQGISLTVLENGGLICVVRDITEHTLAEEALQLLTKFRESVITNARVWLSVLDQRGRILMWNTAAEECSGYSSFEVIGKNEIWKLLYPQKEYRKHITDTITRIISDRKYLENFETTIRTKQGNERIISWNTRGIPDTTGRISDFIAIGVDVTDRHLAEEALKESEERYLSLFDRSLDCIYIHDLEGNFIDANPAAFALLGYTREDIPHFSFTSLISGDQLKKARKTIKTIVESGSHVDLVEYRLQKKNREFVDVETKGSLILHGKKPYAILGIARDITERKKAEKELRDTEHRLGDIISFLPDATFAIDREGKVIAWNRAIEEMTGVRAEDMLGKGDYEYALPFYGERRPILIDLVMIQDPGALKKYISVQSDGDSLTAETTWTRPGGKNIYLWGKSILFKNDQGNVVGAIESIRDITDRRIAEELLKENREKYRELVESISDVIYEVDNRGMITYISPVARNILEFEPEEIIGRHFADLIYPEDRDLLSNRFSELTRGVEYPLDYRILTKSGGLRWVRSRTKSIMKGDEFSGARGTLIDITERKRVELALYKNKAQLATAMDMADLVDWEFDVTTGTFLFNDRFYTLYGTTAEREGGYTMQAEVYVKEFVHPADIPHVTRVIGDVASVTDPDYCTQLEHRIIRRDGQVRYIVVRFEVIMDSSGTLIKTYGANQDITERKRSEVALSQANKKLTLLSSITRHDINNQLTVLMGYLAILEKKQPDPSFKDYFQKVATAAQRISAMIRFTKEYESIGVNAPVWQDCSTLIDTAAEEALLGKVTVKNDLPAGAEVFADPLIVKVFYNLMDNAARYGEKITTIRFAVEERDGDHVMVCEDDGVGVIAEEKEKIFERGFGKNTGLGLALAREILDITGITIQETGEPGKGARFEITVPKGTWRMTGNGA